MLPRVGKERYAVTPAAFGFIRIVCKKIFSVPAAVPENAADMKTDKKRGAEMPYKTKQRDRLDELIKSLGDRHFTADEADSLLRSEGEAVGRSTIYRYLERLVSDGTLKKFASDDGKCACYQYTGGKNCGEHFHLKCTECGKVIHLECDRMNEFAAHLVSTHGFYLDCAKTILCGRCSDCADRARKG